MPPVPCLPLALLGTSKRCKPGVLRSLFGKRPQLDRCTYGRVEESWASRLDDQILRPDLGCSMLVDDDEVPPALALVPSRDPDGTIRRRILPRG